VAQLSEIQNRDPTSFEQNGTDHAAGFSWGESALVVMLVSQRWRNLTNA
jgi:hypothetical protein